MPDKRLTTITVIFIVAISILGIIMATYLLVDRCTRPQVRHELVLPEQGGPPIVEDSGR